ncbi:AP-4 complex subunit epsilon-1-like [Mytilus californianus]|uniref:AP-4 complex subunit epsilon-1-like n=1 Tax=Mytilus californianus TaxID=6549 RepID=UPI002246E670|nr:AP-4 complex subunit epsilon-1-like [Mytilus californianus]
MSDVVEKTIAALPKIFGENLLGGISQGVQSPKYLSGLGRCFQTFVRLLHKSKTKNEEDQFIKTQITEIKEQFKYPSTRKDQEKDLLFICVYCHMMGYNVDFAKVKAFNMCAGSDEAMDTKIGWVTANLLLPRNDETSILATSSMVKNLSSPNLLEVCNVMATVAHFTMPQIIEFVLPYLQKTQNHTRSLVRAKAVMCIYMYYLQVPELFLYEEDSFYKSLCDPDPSVMAAACYIFHELVKKDRKKYLSLVPVLVNILQQIIERKLPSSYEYHSIPSPWLQIKILKMLALLGADNQRESEMIYPVLQAVFERTGIKDKMCFAICYECIQTSTSIYPNQELLQAATQAVGNFLRAKDLTLKYIGIKALTGLVRVSQEFALQYQIIVVELLDDPDETVQRKTLALLYNMTNSVNVQPVCDKLLQHMINSSDPFHKEDLLHKIVELTQKFFKPEVWFVDILFKVLQICPSSSSSMVMNKVIATLRKGITRNTEFCQHLVKKSVECLFREDLLEDMVKLASWIIGQEAELLKNMPKDKLMALFTKQLSRQHITVMTKLWLTNALMNLVTSNILMTDTIAEPVEQLLKTVNDVIIVEKLQELVRISQLKPEISKPKIEKMDFTLSFLDNYVSKSVKNGAQPYRPKNMRSKQTQQEQGVTELFKGIQNQGKMEILSRLGEDVASSGGTSFTASDSVSKLPSVKKVWGKEGRIIDTQETKKDEDDHITEEDRNRQQMVSALFGGIMPGQVEKTVEQEPDPFFTEEDNFDIKSAQPSTNLDTGGWRQLHQSSGDPNSPNKTISSEYGKLVDDLSLSETQFSENYTGEPFVAEQTLSKHHIDNDSFDKHLSDTDLLPSGGGGSLYEDFVGDVKNKDEKSIYSDSLQTLYDDDSVS